MNPWLQELPDPITKLVWDNAAIVSPEDRRGVRARSRATVVEAHGERHARSTMPVFVLPGQADYSVALAFGQYGEMRIAHVPDGGGTNVYPLRKSNAHAHRHRLQARRRPAARPTS